MQNWQSRVTVAITALGIVTVWFIPELVAWHLQIPYTASDFGIVFLPKYIAIMITVAILCELRWHTPGQLHEAPVLKRVALLTIFGSAIAGEILNMRLPQPSVSSWAGMSLLAMLGGGLQMALLGTVCTAVFSGHSSRSQR